MPDPLTIAAWAAMGTLSITGLALVVRFVSRLGRASVQLEQLGPKADRFDDRLERLASDLATVRWQLAERLGHHATGPPGGPGGEDIMTQEDQDERDDAPTRR